MNHNLSIANLLIAKGKGQAVGFGRVTALVIGLSALVLATFVAAPGYVAAADIAHLATDSQLMSTHCPNAEFESEENYAPASACWSEYMAVNPELMAARLYIGSSEQERESGFVASNPELMAARRYVGSAEQGREATFLAANPELMTARRYVGSAEQVTDAIFLAANPELIIARR